MVSVLVACGGGKKPAGDDAFWAWFSEHANALAKSELGEARDQVQHELDVNEPGVSAEMTTEVGVRVLVLSADGDQAVFPRVKQVFAARPKVPGWKIVAFRQRQSGHIATLVAGDKKLAPLDMRYVATPAGDKLDLVAFVPGYAGNDKVVGSLAFSALDYVVGEYDVETKLAAIKLLPLDQAPPAAHPIAELPAELDKLPTR